MFVNVAQAIIETFLRPAGFEDISSVY